MSAMNRVNVAKQLEENAVLSIGSQDVVMNGAVHGEVPAIPVMVGSQSDLANLPAYQPGTIAYTTGFKKIWQLGADGTWVEV